MSINRIELCDCVDLSQRFAPVAADNPGRLDIELRQVPARGNVPWSQSNRVEERLADLTGQRKAPGVFGGGAVRAAQPPSIL